MARVSRADLVRLLGAPGADLATQAAALGFDYHPRVGSPKKTSKPPGPVPPEPPPPPTPPATVKGSAFLWLVTGLSTQAERPARHPSVPVPAVLKQRANPRAVPTGERAAPWSSVWSRIYALLCEDQRAHAVDLPAVTARLSSGRPLVRVPRARRRAWPAHVLILQDRRAAMMPMAGDMAQVTRRLQGLLGAARVRVHRLPARAQCRDAVPRLVRAIGAHTRVLALTDLGGPAAPDQRVSDQRASDQSAAFWRALGGALRRAGVAAGALVPGHRGAAHPTWRVRGWTDSTARGSTADQVERLLALATISRWTQPGLLRALRRCLPVHQADLGTELAVWRSARLKRAGLDGFVIEREAARRLRSAWRRFPTQTRQAAWACVLDWHRDLPAELQSAEALAYAQTEPGAGLSAADRAFIEAVADALRATTPEDAPLRDMLHRYGRALLGDLPDSAYADDALGQALQAAWVAAFDGVEIEPPDTIAPEAFQTPGREPARAVALRQRGDALTTAPGRGPLIATVMTSERVWRVTTPQRRRQQAIRQPISLVGHAAVTIETNRSTLTLERVEQPPWADAIGRDRQGPFADAHLDGARHRLRWRVGKGWRGADRDGRRNRDGRRYGADSFGVFEDVRIKGVPVRFRLIPAGTFMMGSPESDTESYADERPQHPVTLTAPFWLMDAPVTQALWQAVMGEKPSRFKGASRPVERVSWEDVMRFTRALASRSGLQLRMPTEAQWEYACRAGTTMPRYGDLGDIAWCGGNSRTYPVKQKRPNAWGLYDMLGNVWEWCSDWRGSYPSGPAVDPQGPAEGAGRVYRGGSLFFVARDVRAAYRNWSLPGRRDDYLGVRLSRGPAPSARSAERAEPASTRRSRGAGPEEPDAP